MNDIVLDVLPGKFCYCKLARPADITACFAVRRGAYWFYAGTEEEESLICLDCDVPENCERVERGWRALSVRGALDFGVTGVLSGISSALSEAGIAVCAVSTFDTDYFLVKGDRLDAAVTALKNRGYAVKD